MARLPIQRGPGDYGIVGARYQVLAMSATPGGDYIVSGNTVVTLPSGVTEATVDITIVDDTEREFAEEFTVTLIEAIGEKYWFW